MDKLNNFFDTVGIDEKLKKAKINLYGNGINWSKAWNCLDKHIKEKFILFLIESE